MLAKLHFKVSATALNSLEEAHGISDPLSEMSECQVDIEKFNKPLMYDND